MPRNGGVEHVGGCECTEGKKNRLGINLGGSDTLLLIAKDVILLKRR